MSADANKSSEELRQLLRRIEEIHTDEPRSLRAPASRAETVERGGQTRPIPDSGSRVISSDLALQRHPKYMAPASAKGAEKPRQVRKWAFRMMVAAVVAGIFVVKVPPVSIIVMRDGIDDLKTRFRPAAPNARDAEPTKSAPRPQGRGDSGSSIEASRSLAPAAVETAEPPGAHRVLAAPRAPLPTGQHYALGPGPTSTLVVRGLAAGARLSVGQPAGANAWQVDGSEATNAVIIPPSGFSGAMDLTIEWLRDGVTMDRQSLLVEWSGKGGGTAPQIPNNRMGAGENIRLLKRGEELLASGEVAAARSMFRRLADSGDAQAALALAETYEPLTLDRLGAKGLAPDIAMARAWYGKAKELGSAEAQRRLDVLASQSK
jgi:hypothetical protein